MPRDGAQIYSPPFPDVAPDTTIASTVYNGFVHDVAQDLNTPRPVVAGGTGASNAADAMNNLGGELSKVAVTNYDSHPFQAGSFYSAASATAAPVAGHAFTGICYVAVVSGVATSDMFIEASDRDDTGQPGAKWVRQKKAGVWSGWQKSTGVASSTTPPVSVPDNSLWWDPTRGKLFIRYNDGNSAQWVEAVAVPDIDPNTFVEISGDVMTGLLTLSGPPVNPLHAATKAYTDSTASSAAGAIAAVRYDTAQSLTVNQRAQARANVDVTKKNYIINGAMMVSQENGSTAGTATGYYPVDMFTLPFSNAGTQTSQQVVGYTPAGSTYRLRVTATAADASVAAGDFLLIQHAIEGFRFADLKCGVPSVAKTITIQFGVKAPAGTYCVSLVNAAFDRSYIAEYVIAAGEANTDVVKSATITLDQTGTWGTGNNAGVIVSWSLMIGSTRQGTANVWQAGNLYATSNQINFMGTNGNVFELFDVSLTEGSVAPPFMVPDYASELAACMRYWERITIAVWQSGFAGAPILFFPYKVLKRATPIAATMPNLPAPTFGGGANSPIFNAISDQGAGLGYTSTGTGSYILGWNVSANARL